MNVILTALTVLFSIAILLIAGFQLIRVFITEFIDMVTEAWNIPEPPSSS